MKKNRKEYELLIKFSHDLRSVLGNIKSLNQLVQEQANELKSKELINVLSLIDLQSDQGLEIVKSILQPIERTNLPLNNFINEIVAVYNSKTEYKRVKVVFVPEQEEVILNTNKATFFRLMTNIIENAIKFSPDNSTISVLFSNCKEKEAFIITVKDNGIGMDKTTLSHLFESKHNIIRNGTENEVSHGLGLQISKEICDNLGYGLHVKSRLNEGSSFCISIPFHHLTYPSKTEVSL